VGETTDSYELDPTCKREDPVTPDGASPADKPTMTVNDNGGTFEIEVSANLISAPDIVEVTKNIRVRWSNYLAGSDLKPVKI
jgi:hypothetical protein